MIKCTVIPTVRFNLPIRLSQSYMTSKFVDYDFYSNNVLLQIAISEFKTFIDILQNRFKH